MIDSPASCRDLFGDLWIAWLCRAGHYALGLTAWCPIDALLCVDDSPVNDQIERCDDVRVYSLERLRGWRLLAGDMAVDEIVTAYRDQLTAALEQARPRRRLLAASVASPSLAALAEQTGAEYAGNPPALVDWLNDKRHLQAALHQLGLPRIAGRWMRLGTRSYTDLAVEFGPRFVAQLPCGASGSGTAFIDSERALTVAGTRFADAEAWVAPDVGDVSLNVNALALADETVVSWPSVQLEGLTLARAARGMYCGNDFAATSDLPRPTIDCVMEQTERVGRWLARLGYRGLFGLDFVLDRTTAMPIIVDLNPRGQGSTALLTLAEDRANRLPLAVADLAWRFGVLGEDEIRRYAAQFRAPLTAAHIGLRCDEAKGRRVGAAIPPGVYTADPPLRFLRDGLRLRDLGSETEVLVTGGNPRAGTRLARGCHILRFSCQGPVMDLSRNRPYERFEAIAAALYTAMRLQ